MPGFPNALRVLAGLDSPTNMTPGPDAYVNKRRAQILGGDDELAPSDAELMQMQDATGGRYSRDTIADAGMSALKRKLGLQKQEQAAALERETAPAKIRGEYGVREAEITAKTAADRASLADTQFQQRQQDMDARLQKTIDARGGLQEDAQAFKVAHPNASSAVSVPAQLYDAVNKSRQGYESMANNPVSRFMFGNGRTTAYQTALTNLLDRKGSLQEVEEVANVLRSVQGGSIDEKITNSGIQGLQALDPYERQYLSLKLNGK